VRGSLSTSAARSPRGTRCPSTNPGTPRPITPRRLVRGCKVRLLHTTGIALTLSLSGCAVGPDYHEPKIKVPEQFTAAPGTAAQGKPGQASQTVDIAKWWSALNDAELNSLIERAIQANPSLEIALTRLQEARTFEVAITGVALPSLEASAGGARG